MTGVAVPLGPHVCLPGCRAHGEMATGARVAAGLAALAALVNDTIHMSVTGRPGPLPASVAGSVDATPATTPAAALGHRPRSLRPRPGPGRPAGASDGGTPDEQPVAGPSEDHAAIWEIVTRAQAGDGEAFGQLYDRYVDTVYRFVYYRVNDRALAEDFTSETFLRALRRISTISYQGRDIGAWFITIARNIVLDHVKSARARLEITTADTIEGREHGPSTESAVLRTLDSERLMTAIATLGEDQRECVMLRFIHGMSVSETAAIMGRNDGAIKALQHRAVRKLADLIGGELR